MKTKRGLITVLIVTLVAAALMVPLIDDVAVEAQQQTPTPTPQPVGGIVEPVDKIGILAPWLGLAALIIVATAATLLFKRGRVA